MIIYVDTSAALKLLVKEAESAALNQHLAAGLLQGDRLVASMLLYTELHCAAGRRTNPPATDAIKEVLNTISLDDLERIDLTFAAAMPGRLRSADAIHLATALRLGVDQLIAYDTELLAAAEAAGLSVLSPA